LLGFSKHVYAEESINFLKKFGVPRISLDKFMVV